MHLVNYIYSQFYHLYMFYYVAYIHIDSRIYLLQQNTGINVEYAHRHNMDWMCVEAAFDDDILMPSSSSSSISADVD